MATTDIQILQFGTGNFLRAFFEPMVQDLNEKGNTLKICVIQTTTGNTLQKLALQNSRYHLLVAGFRAGQKTEHVRQITCIQDGLRLPDEAEKFLDFASSPTVKWIVSNVTEAGMVWKNEGPFEKFAESFPGRITQWLHKRYQLLPTNETVFLPCELLPKNGDLLKSFIHKHAECWHLGDQFLNWLDEKAIFLNSLVDRIVPGFPSHLNLSLKDQDPLLVQTEPYSFWAIEGPEGIRPKLPFLEANSEVILAPDISGFSVRKVRILNGSHTAMTGIGLLNAISTVGQWIEDPAREAFLRELIIEEILPTIQLDKADLLTYLDDVIDRFKNPFVAHRLSDISLNSISKIKSRLIPTMEDFKNKMGFLPSRLSYCLLGLVLFYLRTPTQIRDTSDVLDWFARHSNPSDEKENLKLALAKWLDLEWNETLESAYAKLT
jgi:tagaturonate reductase